MRATSPPKKTKPTRELVLEFGELSLSSMCTFRCELEVTVGGEVFRTSGRTADRNRLVVPLTPSSSAVVEACVKLQCRGFTTLNNRLCRRVEATTHADQGRGVVGWELGQFWTMQTPVGQASINNNATTTTQQDDWEMLARVDGLLASLSYALNLWIVVWMLRRGGGGRRRHSPWSGEKNEGEEDDDDDDDGTIIETATRRSPVVHAAASSRLVGRGEEDWWRSLESPLPAPSPRLPSAFSSISKELLRDPNHPGWRTVFDGVYDDDKFT